MKIDNAPIVQKTEEVLRYILRKFNFEKEMRAITIEASLRLRMVCSYNPNFSNLLVHLNAIDKAIKFYSKTDGKILIAGYSNTQVIEWDKAALEIQVLNTSAKNTAEDSAKTFVYYTVNGFSIPQHFAKSYDLVF